MLNNIQTIFLKNPILWLLFFIIITVILELISCIIKKKFETKNFIIVVLVCSVITALVAGSFSLFFPTPNISKSSVSIPTNIVRSDFKIILYDYYGEYTYDGDSKKHFIDNYINKTAQELYLLNEDYDVKFTDFSINKNENGEIIYVFDNIPAGNYIVHVDLEGYLVRNEHTSLDVSGRSHNYKDNTYWWSMHLVMEKMDIDTRTCMSIRFFDSKYKPIENLKYEIINSPYKKTYSHSYKTETDADGECQENISIVPNTGFWIAYIDPYINNEQQFYVKALVDERLNWCDIILVLDENGGIQQMSPYSIWYENY